MFLLHLPILSTTPEFTSIWMRILDFLDKYMQQGELLMEAIPESLKNMLLVMSTSGVFKSSSTVLWDLTWHRIGQFLPDLRQSLFPEQLPARRNDASRSSTPANDTIPSAMQSIPMVTAPPQVPTTEFVLGPPIDVQQTQQGFQPSQQQTANTASASASDPSESDVPLHPHPIFV